jgi:threonine aldolase
MGNAVAIMVHATPGEEVILEAGCHIMNYELASMASFAGVMPRPIQGEWGFPTAEQVESAIRSPIYYHCRAVLVCLENTHNMAGGGIYPRRRYEEVVALAKRRKLKVHLDGARLFNASVASGVAARDLASGADSVMVTLSKGLAAPAGSLVAGSRAFIEDALRVRKRLGGGMRQVGILAAAGIVALSTMIDRLREDHACARMLAGRLCEIPGLELDPETVETNIVIFRSTRIPAPELAERLRAEGVLCLSIDADRLRMVTHLDVSPEQAIQAAAIARRVASA